MQVRKRRENRRPLADKAAAAPADNTPLLPNQPN
jgi:hypothetical protein